MDLATAILGTHTVTRLKEASDAAVLQIGNDHLTRGELAAVGCYNFLAARRMSQILRALKVPNLKHLYEHVPPGALALPMLGSISLAVLGAAFEAKGIGGASPLENYARKHLVDGAKIVTFETMKQREHQEAAREQAERRARKRARRNKAHQLRVERFETRTGMQAQ